MELSKKELIKSSKVIIETIMEAMTIFFIFIGLYIILYSISLLVLKSDFLAFFAALISIIILGILAIPVIFYYIIKE